jgi:hypothetical protein
MDNSTPLKSTGKAFKKLGIVIAGVILVAIIGLVSPLVLNNPVDYADINNHFKYGSIGSEPENGVPYWIWKVLPAVFPDKLPGEGYQSLGFLYEPGKDRPIGFSQRRVLIDRVGLNCAICHLGSLRETPESEPQLIPTMPSNTVNLQGYIQFLGKTALDERFTPNRILAEIDAQGGKFNPIQKLIYRYLVIPQTRDALITQASQLAFLNEQPDWGPGRVDTFNPYKSIQFRFPMDKLEEDEKIGTADLPSIWNQKPREGLQLHWDGDNTSVHERNLSAALGAGVTPVTADLERIKRIEDWLWELPSPAYPYAINRELAAKGQPIYQNNCASCHAFGGAKVGKVTPIGEIGTDSHRLDSYTYELLSNQNTLFVGTPERFKNFRKTDGYANMPLDGIWLRSPYLHNGSVPTLRDLLEAPDNRPLVFYRGYDVFDQENVGFVSTIAQEKGTQYFKFDTTVPGNSNRGHLYGTNFSSEDKAALVEYLKTL